MANNLEDQKRETFWVFSDLQSKQALPEMAIVDFNFVPENSTANWSGFMKEISDLGYESDKYEDGSALEISTRPMALSAERIWFHEQKFTIIGQKFGFAPDGWGFFGVENDGTLSS
ncbi:MAG: ribonuclease E inhibitor RraB [Marinosulfonomonas sp.]